MRYRTAARPALTRNLSRHRNRNAAPTGFRPKSRRSSVLVSIRLLRLAQRSRSFSAEPTDSDSAFVSPFFTSGQAQPFFRRAMQPWLLPAPPPQSQRSRDNCWSLPEGSTRQSIQPGLPSGFCSVGTTASALAAQLMARERLFWPADALGRAGLFLRSPLPPGVAHEQKQLGLSGCMQYPGFALCFPYGRPARTAGRSCRQPSPRS